MIDDIAIRLRFEALAPVLDERGRRRFAAAEALAAGHEGVTAVARVTGIARSTINRGLAERREGATPGMPVDRVRRAGGGRKPLTAGDETLLGDLPCGFHSKRDTCDVYGSMGCVEPSISAAQPMLRRGARGCLDPLRQQWARSTTKVGGQGLSVFNAQQLSAQRDLF